MAFHFYSCSGSSPKHLEYRGRSFAQYFPMLVWARRRGYALIAPVILLAGCAVGHRGNLRHVPDWEAEDVVAPETQMVPTLQSSQPPVATPAPPTNAPASPPVVAAPTRAAPAPPPRPTWVSLERWCKDHNLPPPRPMNQGPQPAFSVNTSNGVFAFHIGTTVATWQGVQLWLGFLPRMVDGQPWLHSLDLQRNLLPLAQTSPVVPSLNRVIVIDPGHGGENAGTRSVAGRNAYEKDYTLDWARRLSLLLEADGWAVFLTRTNDTDLDLSNRVNFAEQHRADLFISLHFNSAAPDETQYGLETYCLPPAGMPSTVTRGFDDETTVVFPNNSFDDQNLDLGFRAHRALLEVNGHHDRGVRRARFLGVLRNQHRPAILVEGGYLSNPGEAHSIATTAFRQKLAQALASAIGPARPNLAQAHEPPPTAPPPEHAPQNPSRSSLFDEP